MTREGHFMAHQNKVSQAGPKLSASEKVLCIKDVKS